jgi:hypothetical protein
MIEGMETASATPGDGYAEVCAKAVAAGRRRTPRGSTEWPAFAPPVGPAAGPLGAVQAADREIARQTAIRARAAAAFAASRPASADRAQGQPGAMSPQRWAARPEILRRVSEWAAPELAVALSLSAAAAEGLLERSLLLVHRLPGTLAALEAGALHPGQLWPLLEHVAPIDAPRMRAEVEAEVLRWAAGRVTTPGQLGAKIRRVTARRDARAAAQRLTRALAERGVSLRRGRLAGLAEVGLLLTEPEAQALHRALGAYADALDDDPAAPRTRGQKMADCLLDLVLRPGASDLPPVQVLLTVVAALPTLAGGDQPGEINGQVVPAELIRELLRALAGSPAGEPGADPSGLGAAPAAEPGAEPDPAAAAGASADRENWQRIRAELADWAAAAEAYVIAEVRDGEGGTIPYERFMAQLPASGDGTDGATGPHRPAADTAAAPSPDASAPDEVRPDHGPPGQSPPDQPFSDEAAPDEAAPDAAPDAATPHEAAPDEAASHNPEAATPPAGWWADADRAVDAAGRVLLDAQQAVGRAARLVRTAAAADAGDEAAWQNGVGGRLTAAEHALDALRAATDAQRAQLAELLDRTAGGGLADRPRLALTDALSGALLALTDLPALRRAGGCGARACRRHPERCTHELTGRPGLGPPEATDGYRPTAALDRFVRARDRRCRFPGCRRRVPKTGELDHNTPWPDGETSAANLAGYCTTDHRGKHQAPGWRHDLAPDGTLTVTTPTGLTAVTTLPPY